MKKTIRDYDLCGKKVLIRVDFNVPMEDGVITDDNRIKQSLPTIEYAMENGAKVILFSHLGRVKTEEDKEKYDLEPIALSLSELLNREILFVDETRGSILEDAINELNNGDILLVQNTRFEDLNGKLESSNDEELGSYWAGLGDLFINDAFGTCHRAHASNVGIASHLPNGVGFLVEKELHILKENIDNPKHPFTVILGGSKVSDKISVVENIIEKADYILIGGGMAYTYLKASGMPIGKSLCDLEHIDFCKNILEKYSDKIVLPIDSRNVTEIGEEPVERFISDFKENEIGVDIGYHTVKLFRNYLLDSSLIIWNGPVGIFEQEQYSYGTKALLDILKDSQGITILGGGDTAASASEFGYDEYMTHISTGGGASLELLEGKNLPGIEIINEKK